MEEGPRKGDEQPEHERHDRRVEGPLTHNSPNRLGMTRCRQRGLYGGLDSSWASLVEMLSLGILREG